MHEFGLCDGIVEAVLERAHGRKVVKATIRVGVLQRVGEGAFQHAFEHSAKGTVAEGATAELVIVPVTANCLKCNVSIEAQDVILVCPECGSVELEMIKGDELILESLEYAATADTSA